MRVAFTLIGGAGWTGGANYLENLLSALHEEAPGRIDARLFVGPEADRLIVGKLSKYLPVDPITSQLWSTKAAIRVVRAGAGYGLQRDYLVEREFKRQGIEVVFQHQAWYGCRFGLPTLAWIADFQHRHLPHMFSRRKYVWRELGYQALSRCASRIMVSSEDARRDAICFLPSARNRIDVVPFVTRAPASDFAALSEVRRAYHLPEKFFFLPNQLWRHKNHLRVIEALSRIGNATDMVIVACGNPSDVRNPAHPEAVLNAIKSYGLEKRMRFIGMIPYAHIGALMRLSAAVVNPSLFEGWSTTVEEARAIGAPLILSDLPIHREQTAGMAVFFDPHDPDDIARVLTAQWSALPVGPRLEMEAAARESQRRRRREFAERFVQVVETLLTHEPCK